MKKDKLPIERGVKGKNFLNYGQKQIIFEKKTESDCVEWIMLELYLQIRTWVREHQSFCEYLNSIWNCNKWNCDEKCTGQVWLNFFEQTIEMVISFLHSIANCSKQHMLLAFSFICNIKMQTHNKENIFFYFTHQLRNGHKIFLDDKEHKINLEINYQFA